MPPPTYQSIHKHHKALCGPLPTCQHWKTKDIWLAITQTSWEHRRHRRSKNIFRGITMGIRPIWGINSLSPFILSLGLISWCSVPWGRGGVLNKYLYGQTLPWGPTPYPVNTPFLTKKVPLSYTFYWQMVPLSHTFNVYNSASLLTAVELKHCLLNRNQSQK